MKKERAPFKLKSGNKPSIAKLSGVERLERKVEKLRRKKSKIDDNREEASKRQRIKADVKLPNRIEKLEKKIYEKSGRKAADEKRARQRLEDQNRYEAAKKEAIEKGVINFK